MKQTSQNFNQKILSYKKVLPSRKVGLVILITLLSIIALFVISSLKGVSYNTSKLSVVTVGGAISKDTDGDGVPDWEERLWGTSSNNTDSDSDGVPDSTEISLKKEQLALQGGYNVDSTYTQSETDIFARELFVTYSALKEQGSISQIGADNIAGAALSSSINKLPIITVHSTSDLKIVQNSEAENTRYKNQVARLAQASGKFGEEFGLINQGIVSNNPDILKTAATYDKVYIDYKTSLLKLDVPDIQALNHVRLLNNLGYLVATLPNIDTLETDVLRGVSLYTVYTKAYQDMFSTFEAIGKAQ